MSIFTKLFKRSRPGPNYARSLSSPLDSPKEGTNAELGVRRTSSVNSLGEEQDVVRRTGLDNSQQYGLGGTRHIRNSISSSGSVHENSFNSRYARIQLFHRGRNAMIMRATDRTTSTGVTLKAYCKRTMTNSKKRALERETELLSAAAGHPGIVCFQRKAEDDDYYYLILESCPGHTLIEEIAYKGKISEPYAAEIVGAILDTLVYLHDRHIVHRDIKPEHIICSKGGVKIVDFAEAADQEQHRLNDRVGTLEYMAPELLSKPTAEEVFHEVLVNGMSDDELPVYSEKADIWSLGATLYEMLTGCQPFFAETLSEMMEAQVAAYQSVGTNGLPQFIAKHPLSLSGQQFLSQMLCHDANKRASARDLLQHPWLKQHRGKKQEEPAINPQVARQVDGSDVNAPRHSTAAYTSPVCFWAKAPTKQHMAASTAKSNAVHCSV